MLFRSHTSELQSLKQKTAYEIAVSDWSSDVCSSDLETHEYTDMYPGMAKTARDEGFDEIADWFETLAKAERSHANRYQKALDQLVD